MADPLTSSDIIRERMGFGVSPLASEDARRSYAAAGLSPLGTQEREAFKSGSGISPMAGSSDKAAWKMAEYMAGQREEAPIEYGGIGERPVGSSRRAIRMQAEYDKRRQEAVKEQASLQAMDIQKKQFELQTSQENRLFNEQQARMNAERLKAKMDEKNAAVKNAAFGVMADTDLNDPSSFSRVVEQLSGVAGALEDEDVRSALGLIRQASDTSMGAIAEKFNMDLQEVAKVSEESGLPMSNFVTTDPTTGRDVIDREALGRAQAIVAKRDPKEPTFGGKTQKELEGTISGINAEIVEATASEDVIKIKGLEAKKKYYEGLMPKENKDVATTAKEQYIPEDEREADKVYPTPKGEMKWTGTGWTKP